MSQLHPQFAGAIAGLQRDHSAITFNGQERHGLIGVQYRIVADVDPANVFRDVTATGWCPTPSAAVAEILHLLGVSS